MPPPRVIHAPPLPPSKRRLHREANVRRGDKQRARILALTGALPGIQGADLAHALGLDASTVNYHADVLTRRGLILAVGEARGKRLYLSSDAPLPVVEGPFGPRPPTSRELFLDAVEAARGVLDEAQGDYLDSPPKGKMEARGGTVLIRAAAASLAARLPDTPPSVAPPRARRPRGDAARWTPTLGPLTLRTRQAGPTPSSPTPEPSEPSSPTRPLGPRPPLPAGGPSPATEAEAEGVSA